MCLIVPSPSVLPLELQRSPMMPDMNDHRLSDALCQDSGRNAAESKLIGGRGRW